MVSLPSSSEAAELQQQPTMLPSALLQRLMVTLLRMTTKGCSSGLASFNRLCHLSRCILSRRFGQQSLARACQALPAEPCSALAISDVSCKRWLHYVISRHLG